jgi:predicted dehydrogenase
MIKVAIAGAGFIGEVHANSYSQIKNVDLVAIVDNLEEKGRKFAEKFGASFYTDLDNLIKSEDVDAIDICTPTFLHPEMAIKAANAGKNVFCEKPLALSLKDADSIIEAVKKNNVKAMVGHVMRFWPEYAMAKVIADSGQLGQPLYAFCERLTFAPDWHEGGWGFNEKFSGGVSVDLHIHDLDYLIWLFGKPTFIRAQGVYVEKLGGLVHIATNMEFKNGKSGHAEGGWEFSSSFPFTMTLRILCEKGTIEWVFRTGKNIEERSKKSNLLIYKADGSIDKPEIKQEDAYLLECKYFIDCLDNNKEIDIATLEDGRNALEIAIAATKSAKERKTIEI